MSEPTQRIVETNGTRLNIAEQGDGPLVLLRHGFPECWYSWRHQFDALAASGFHVVAPDMRGYGKSDRPEAIDHYTIFHFVGDMVGVLDAPETSTAVIAGHDVGANVAWQAALLRPDRFRAVIGLSVPFRPRQGASDQRHAADGRGAILPAPFPGARRRRSGIRTGPASDRARHALRRVRRCAARWRR